MQDNKKSAEGDTAHYQLSIQPTTKPEKNHPHTSLSDGKDAASFTRAPTALRGRR